MDDAKSALAQLVLSLFPESATAITLNSSFLHLGGDSLMAASLTSKLYKRWGVRLSVRQILQAERLDDLIPFLGEMREVQTTQRVFPEVNEQFEQSPSQAMVYLEFFRNPETTAYNIPIIATIPGAISLERFANALQDVVRCFPILFAHFFDEQGTGYFRATEIIDVPVERFSSIAAAATQFVRPFSLNKEPLIRAALVPYDGKQTSLMLDFNHIVSDGVSIGYFVERLKLALYGKPLLPESNTTFAYCRWLAGPEYRKQYEEDEIYWKDLCCEFQPKPVWPSDNGLIPGTNPGFGYDVCYANVDVELATKLRQLAEKTSTTPFTLMLLSYFLLQTALTDQWKSQVGVVVSGRSEPAFFDTFGMFVNTLIVPVTIEPDISIAATIGRLNNRALSVIDHQCYPVKDQVRLAGAKSADGSHPLIDVLFAFQNISYQKIDLFGGRFRSFCEAKRMAQFGTVIHLFDLAEQGYQLHWEYCPQRFKPPTVTAFISVLFRILNRLAQYDLDAPVATLLERDKHNLHELPQTTLVEFDFGE